MTFPKAMATRNLTFQQTQGIEIYALRSVFYKQKNSKSFIADYISDGMQIQQEYRAIRKRDKLYTLILFCTNKTVSVEILILELFIHIQYNPICIYKNTYTFIYVCIVNEQKNTRKTVVAKETLMRLNLLYIFTLHIYKLIYIRKFTDILPFLTF